MYMIVATSPSLSFDQTEAARAHQLASCLISRAKRSKIKVSIGARISKKMYRDSSFFLAVLVDMYTVGISSKRDLTVWRMCITLWPYLQTRCHFASAEVRMDRPPLRFGTYGGEQGPLVLRLVRLHDPMVGRATRDAESTRTSMHTLLPLRLRDAHEAEVAIDFSSGSLQAEHRRGRGHQGDHAGTVGALKNAMSVICTMDPSCISPSARSRSTLVSDMFAAAHGHWVARLQRARPSLKARDEIFPTVCLQKRDSTTPEACHRSALVGLLPRGTW